eukprot:TRINITY_DN1515_c0_g1_i1.p2 TRINITY_DN1515_c0_g1~~TRINITY_DN1515_c0_g1_i1.p2  ORF type:complete len:232 (+),score=128.70 TRINITY_DN1515_c0_g1_i1:70-696(+)
MPTPLLFSLNTFKTLNLISGVTLTMTGLAGVAAGLTFLCSDLIDGLGNTNTHIGRARSIRRKDLLLERIEERKNNILAPQFIFFSQLASSSPDVAPVVEDSTELSDKVLFASSCSNLIETQSLFDFTIYDPPMLFRDSPAVLTGVSEIWKKLTPPDVEQKLQDKTMTPALLEQVTGKPQDLDDFQGQFKAFVYDHMLKTTRATIADKK